VRGSGAVPPELIGEERYASPTLILTASAFARRALVLRHAQDAAPLAGDSGLQSLVAEALAHNPTARSGKRPSEPLRSVSDRGRLTARSHADGRRDGPAAAALRVNQSDSPRRRGAEPGDPVAWLTRGSLRIMQAAAAGARAEEGTVRREVTTTMAVAYYRLGYVVTALETLRHQRNLLEPPSSSARRATPLVPRRKAIPSRQSWPAIACGPKVRIGGERVAALGAVNARRKPGTGRLGRGHLGSTWVRCVPGQGRSLPPTRSCPGPRKPIPGSPLAGRQSTRLRARSGRASRRPA